MLTWWRNLMRTLRMISVKGIVMRRGENRIVLIWKMRSPIMEELMDLRRMTRLSEKRMLIVKDRKGNVSSICCLAWQRMCLCWLAMSPLSPGGTRTVSTVSTTVFLAGRRSFTVFSAFSPRAAGLGLSGLRIGGGDVEMGMEVFIDTESLSSSVWLQEWDPPESW